MVQQLELIKKNYRAHHDESDEGDSGEESSLEAVEPSHKGGAVSRDTGTVDVDNNQNNHGTNEGDEENENRRSVDYDGTRNSGSSQGAKVNLNRGGDSAKESEQGFSSSDALKASQERELAAGAERKPDTLRQIMPDIKKPPPKSQGQSATAKPAQQQQQQATRRRRVVRLKLDEIPMEPRHVAFSKLDRLTKLARTPMGSSGYGKHTDANRLDNAVAHWTLAINQLPDKFA